MRNIIYLLFSLVFALALVTTLSAQELPPIVNYPTKSYNAANQNWSITQNDDKTIYIANNDGLLEFNGANWQLYPSPNQTVIRSVRAIDQVIYTGSYMDFGYWKKNINNSLSYTSLTSSLQLQMLEDEQIWTILPYSKRVLFQSLNRIYIYNTDTFDVAQIESNNTIHKIFAINNQVYFQVANEGLYKIVNEKKVLVSDIDVFKKDVVVGIFSAEDQLSFVFRNAGIFNYNDTDLKPWNRELNIALQSVSIYSSEQLDDGDLILGTISNGIIHVAKDGKINYTINQYNGLSDNTALSLFEDMDSNLWVGLDNGIDCINLSSPYTNYIDQLGNLGTIYSSILFEGDMYLGTNQGLFVKSFDTDDNFRLVEGTEGQVWFLKSINNQLFCGHNNGTYIINAENALKISSEMGAWGISEIKNANNLLLQGNYNGLFVLEKLEDTWSLRNKIEGFNISSRYFEMINAREVLVSHEYKGVYNIKLDDSLRQAVKVSRDTSVIKGLNSSLVSYRDNIYYANQQGVFQYDNSINSFLKEPELSSIYENDKYITGKLVADKSNGLWAFTENYIHYITRESLSNEFQFKKIPIPKSLRDEMKGYENISKVYSQNYLFGASNGYLMMNVTDIREKQYDIYLNAVHSGTSINENKKVAVANALSFAPENNFISFEYSVPEYSKYVQAEFQYRLEGSQVKEWSNWSTNYSVSFNNLDSGDYIFNVRGRVNNREIKDTATYVFTIDKPWYTTHLALIILGLGLLIALLSANYLYKRYYHKKRTREEEKKARVDALKELEVQKELIQLRNDKLNSDIEARNRELAVSAMSMINKNNALNDLKAEVLKIGESKTVKSIVQRIDASLDDKEDWKFFEEAFNHADKDFFKKVKEKHPSLTANDLRLCVYLRLNLSSKEIAPLLNISPRSVEIKRYRLRKKIELPKEVNLNNYFIEM